VKVYANMESDLHNVHRHLRLMIIFCLAALGLSLTVIAHAIRGAGEGYQDDLGFHNDPRTDSDL
jgi:hypothetical protein